jgi:hypothetical protein
MKLLALDPRKPLAPFFLRLATEVDWNEESACFENFARETARFYRFGKAERGPVSRNSKT